MMLNVIQQQELEKQQYRFVGSHSAVKVCGWTKNMLRGKGGCYKYAFYGIRSHQCLQMTTAMFCANRCAFCWRGTKAPVSKTWYGPVDDPTFIIEHAFKEHLDLLLGFGGHPHPNQKAVAESSDIRHVALSLTGEPIAYPLINTLIDEFHKRKVSTFLVTNAQYPEKIKDLHPVTQLYLSVDAPDKELLKQIDKPLFPDYWERLLDSLRSLAEKKFRTCIRLTIVKGINDTGHAGYAQLIARGKPDFIEVKGYMFVGASRQVLSLANMPYHEEVKVFAEQLLPLLPDYELVAEHTPSRVVLLIKKSLRGKRFINFPKFFRLVAAGKDIRTKDISELRMQPN
ncbi:4-demethylwyosine synthase TYW1 [Candidatus Woesearchaeota archaeon]|nr:4-demethylwyosine synthase TYW1 [Candidatus Woesearchaeota archaeon]